MKLFALSLALCVRASFSADAAADLQKKFVGSWKLISIDGPNQQPINGTPFGIIMYDNTGHMAVQIVPAHFPERPRQGYRHGTSPGILYIHRLLWNLHL